MAIPESPAVDTEQPLNDRGTVRVSAIQRQQAAQSLFDESVSPDQATSEQTHPGTRSRKNLWFIVIGLMLLLVVFLSRYQDVLLPLVRQVITIPELSVGNGQLQRQLDMAGAVNQVLLEEPYRLGQLVTLYRDILLESPKQPDALLGLNNLPRQCLLLASFYLASGQLDITRQIVEDALLYFPKLSDDPHWQLMMINIPEATAEVAIVEGVADEEADELIEEQEREVVAAPETEGQIVESTLLLVGAVAGSSVPPEVLPLPESAEPIFAEPIREATINPSVDIALAGGALPSAQQDTIGRLLREARDFNQKGIQFTQQHNALTRYLEVLALQPDQVDATKGLQVLVDTRIAYVKRLLDEQDLDTALLMLEPALRYFPANLQLLSLSRELDARGGLISSLAVDFLPDEKMDPVLVTVDGQTLLLSFSYKYFPAVTTVVNAQLSNLPQLEPIAAVPIIIQDPRGSKTVQMSTLTRKIEDGRYQLTLSSDGKPLINHEFTVKNDLIDNSGGL